MNRLVLIVMPLDVRLLMFKRRHALGPIVGAAGKMVVDRRVSLGGPRKSWVLRPMDFNDISPNGLDITEAYDLLEPVVIYIVGMSVYGIFVFKFHQFVSSKHIFGFDVFKHEKSKFHSVRVLLHVVLYVGKYLIIFPVAAFF